MATRRVATVFGGSGFIGRYVVKRLAHQGYIVRVAVRDPEAALFLKSTGAVGQVVPLYASLLNEATVRRAVEGAEAVVNLVGILAESRAASFQTVHTDGAERIARSSAAAGGQPAGADLCHRRRSCQRKPVRCQQGQSRTGGARRLPGCHDHAAVAGVRPRRQILQPFSPKLARLSPIMPVIRRPYQNAASLCLRRRRRGDGRAGLAGDPGQDVRTRRPASLDVPGDPGLHPQAEPAAIGDWSISRCGSPNSRLRSCSMYRASH